MTVLTFMDGYRDLPPRIDPRAVFEHELRRLKALYRADPSDDELREVLAEAEPALRAFDRGSAA